MNSVITVNVTFRELLNPIQEQSRVPLDDVDSQLLVEVAGGHGLLLPCLPGEGSKLSIHTFFHNSSVTILCYYVIMLRQYLNHMFCLHFDGN
jgi:hypothetical protein